MARGNPHRQIEHIHPVLLRRHIVDTVRAVRVCVDKAGNDGLADNVDGLCTRRNRDIARFADRFDPVVLDEHDAIVDNAAALISHSHNPRAGERYYARRPVALHWHRQRNTAFRWLEFCRLAVFFERCRREKSICFRRIPNWPQRPM